jgi:hypothetical protein
VLFEQARTLAPGAHRPSTGRPVPCDGERSGGRRGGWYEAVAVRTGWGGGGLRRPADVTMVQATDFWNLDDHAESRWLDWSSMACVSAE